VGIPIVSVERRRPPAKRLGITAKLEDARDVGGGLSVLATINLYPDGRPCELFLSGPKPGSPMDALLEDVAMLVSHLIQRGLPLREMAEKLAREPPSPLAAHQLDAALALRPGEGAPSSILGMAFDLLLEIEGVAEKVSFETNDLP
jgi:hypothetical protein